MRYPVGELGGEHSNVQLALDIAAFGPLRASLHRKGRRSKDEVADQSLISSIRVSCKSSLADCRMLACPKAEIVDSLDKAD